MQENIEDRLLLFLNDSQKKAVLCEDNCILTACPGSGKTRTLTHRIAYLSHKYANSKLLNIAITYTNRAAYEIEDRIDNMDIPMNNIWIGTIHQFCMEFIIRPYYIFHSRLHKGYLIIDEFKKDKYINIIKRKLNINKEYGLSESEKRLLDDEYCKMKVDNKEIDFDDILELSYELLSENDFISRNISNIIRSINVDEYQDTRDIQYLIFSKIFKKNKNILVSFVGDINQSIYETLGGCAKSDDEISEMFGIEFKKIKLNGCYRSTSRIISYYQEFEVIKQGTYSLSYEKDEQGIIYFNKNIDISNIAESIGNILESNFKCDIPENEICILCPRWYMAYDITKYLKERYPNKKFDAIEVSPLKYDPMNFIYLIAKILFLRGNKNLKMKHREAIRILNILQNEFSINLDSTYCVDDLIFTINRVNIIFDDGIQTLKNTVNNVLRELKIDINEKIQQNYNNYFEKVEDKVRKYDLPIDYNSIAKTFREKDGIVISTIHGVKGEEFTTVIAFGLLDGFLPHNNYLYDNQYKPYKDINTNHLLYVLCSRAKKNLYLFAETGRRTQKGYPYRCNYKLEKYQFNYNKIVL